MEMVTTQEDKSKIRSEPVIEGVKRAFTSTGFRLSVEVEQKENAIQVKEEPDSGSNDAHVNRLAKCSGSQIIHGEKDLESEVKVKTEPRDSLEESDASEITSTDVVSKRRGGDEENEVKPETNQPQNMSPEGIQETCGCTQGDINIKVKEEPGFGFEHANVDQIKGCLHSQTINSEKLKESELEVKAEPVGSIRQLTNESEKAETNNVCKKGEEELKSESNQHQVNFSKTMTYKEYRAYRRGKKDIKVKDEPDLVVVDEKPEHAMKENTERIINGVKVEDGDFPEDKDWYLVGGTMVTAVSTSKGRKLVDNEIVHFVFSNTQFNSHQWIVRFCTKRSGEIGRLPMEWGKCVVQLVSSNKVKLIGRCIAAPPTLYIMQEIMLYVSFYIHSSIFTEVDKTTWKLGTPSNIDSTTYPLLTLFKLLKIGPYQKAEFTPEELDTRKRSLDSQCDEDEAAAMLPIVKRRKGCQQYPEQEKDEQALPESSLNKLVGAVDTYNLEEMEPPHTLTSSLKPYQKQALYWMSECEKGIDVEKAAETQHPCWAAYRINDPRASSIYLNIFSGEATTQFPTAMQMARGGILADAMGLGKTVMAISLILARPGKGNMGTQDSTNVKRAKGGTLIVCPMALLGQWKDELETHSEPESMSIFVHYGGYRTNDPRVLCGYDVVLTTYGVLTAAYKSDLENSIFHRVEWYRVVLDEAHTIKSWKTVGAQAAFKLSSQCRWCLTGTPLQNNLEDLYSLLCFLRVEPWCNWAWWSKMIQRPYENGDPRGMKLIKAILRPLMLRRTKETKDNYGRPILVLPPTDIKIIECEQSEAEHDFYDALFRRSKVQFDQFVAQGKVLHNYASILELLLRLRQCCNHPFLVLSRADSQRYTDLNKLARRFLETNAESASSGQAVPTRAYVEEVVEDIRKGENNECPICMEYADDPVLTPCAHRMCRECLLSSWRTSTTGLCPICRTLLKKSDLFTCPTENKFRVDIENNWKESSKVSKLLQCLEQIRISGSGEKSIIFSQWTSFFDLLEIPLRSRGIGFLRFDGKLVQKQREKVLKEFNETKEKMVLLMSLKAGGVGLNLTAASNVFLMDPWWNPAVEEQAIMRIHRIGQKRTVKVRRFIVKDTVEERLQQVQAKKQRMIAGALTDEEVRSARIEQLKMLFR